VYINIVAQYVPALCNEEHNLLKMNAEVRASGIGDNYVLAPCELNLCGRLSRSERKHPADIPLFKKVRRVEYILPAEPNGGERSASVASIPHVNREYNRRRPTHWCGLVGEEA